jgi:rod shape-determining protein MreD
MINDWINSFARLLVFTLLQILVLNNVMFSGFINPYLYVITVLMLPFNTPAVLVMSTGFVSGLLIDIFQDSLGMHAAASVLMAYSRSYVLKLFSPREGYDTNAEPTLHYLGNAWFLSYSILLISIHHVCYFFIEVFRISEIIYTLIRIVASIISTSLLVYIVQMLIYKPKDSRIIK